MSSYIIYRHSRVLGKEGVGGGAKGFTSKVKIAIKQSNKN